MNDRVKNIIVSIVFMFSIILFLILSIFFEDTDISFSERRKLTQFPNFTWNSVKNASFMKKLDEYSVDQFPFREEFRSIKAYMQLRLFGEKDNNKVYVVGDNVLKIEYPFSEKSVIRGINKLNEIYNKYLQNKDMKIYYSIIPDKNYFIAEQYGYPCIDYEQMVSLMNEKIEQMEYIDIFDCLDIHDYYKTDTHWAQDRLTDVVNTIAVQMNFIDRLTNNYIIKEVSDFYGVYYGQLALNIKPDTLCYLTNATIENAVVFDFEENTQNSVYNFEKLSGMDKYDMFLSGPRALLRIDNPTATTDKELIVFRDSFGSSIVPMFIEAYSSITLVDIRYISSDILDKYIEFNNQDVLFLYSTLVLNNSTILK